MGLVSSRDQIWQNIDELERLRAMHDGRGHRDYLSLIKLGTCFVPYKSGRGLAFAPSRFIGYVDNTLSKHAANDSKDGRKTNPAITELLGHAPVEDAELDEQYRAFCQSLGFEARPTGNFGAPRKFWPAPRRRT